MENAMQYNIINLYHRTCLVVCSVVVEQAESRQAYATSDLWRKLNASTQHSDDKPWYMLRGLLKVYSQGHCCMQLHVVQFVL
jgi:hypothetical protein